MPHQLARDWLRALPKRSLLILKSDHWVFPTLYVQQIERVRPDITVFNIGFQNSSWYWRWLSQLHPHISPLKQPDPQRDEPPRLWSLIEQHDHIYLESTELLPFTPRARPPLLERAPCVSGWGLNLYCSHPTPLPPPERLRAWAQDSAHHDLITQRVLARLGVELTLNVWGDPTVPRADLALALGYAALGETYSLLPHPPQRWSLPAQIRSEVSAYPIGDPALLRALLEQLNRSIRSAQPR